MSGERIMPIDHLSYAAFTQLLRNPLIFKLKYVLGVYDGKRGVSNMVGSAGHEALRYYYGGDPDRPVFGDRAQMIGDAIEVGMKFLSEYHDSYINYGKTGSREQMLGGFAKAMHFYFAEEPKYHELLMVEEKMTATLHTLDGQELPLPASGVPDLVHKREDGGVEVIDNKFVRSFTSTEDEDYIKIVQAMFLKYLLLAKGIKADRCLFREIKWTENKGPNEGMSQIQDYAVPFDHEPYDIIFINLYAAVVEFLKNPNAVYLPNLSDPFDGEMAGLLYAQGLTTVDMSDVEVMHKVKDVAFTLKKFVPSRLDRAENAFLPPAERVRMRLMEFGIPLELESTKASGSFTQYRFKVSAGVSMNAIKKHSDDIRAVLETKSPIMLHTPVQGTNLLGIDVENADRKFVKLGKQHFQPGTLTLPVGVDASGVTHHVPLTQAPHLLIAGTTGSGKSTLVHNLIESAMRQLPPEQLEIILIDPKRVELASFARRSHVRAINGCKVVFEQEDALRAFLWATGEMERRYGLLEKSGKRDIEEYNASKRKAENRLPYIVLVVDEFADLVLRSRSDEKRRKTFSYGSKSKRWLFVELQKRAGKSGIVMVRDDASSAAGGMRRVNIGAFGDYDKDALIDMLENLDSMDELKSPEASVEHLVVRLAQQGRAAGVHLILATQRPSADVVTGLIRANFPTRIALMTASATDSGVILGKPGAEKLSGKGDMLYAAPWNRGEVRLQGFAN